MEHRGFVGEIGLAAGLTGTEMRKTSSGNGDLSGVGQGIVGPEQS